VESGVYSAEYGRNPGQVNVTTKSGTNDYHLTAFEFLRNDAVDSETWRQVGPKTPFRRNQFGATFAGKLIKDRLFFMSNYEGLRDRSTVQEVASVATDPMRIGNFSGISTLIYDPASRVYTTDVNGNQVAVSATPFPGNVIPSSRLNPVSIKMLQYFPNATTPGNSINRNYVGQEPNQTNEDAITERIDFNENTKSFWFGRFGWDNEYFLPDATFPDQAPHFTVRAYQAMVANTRTFGANTVNEFRFGYTQFGNSDLTHFANIKDVTAGLGIAGLIEDGGPTGWGVPNVTFGNGITGFGDPADGPNIIKNKYFQWLDNVSIIKGSHSFRFGGEIRRDRYDGQGNVYSRPAYVFAANIASDNPAAATTTGYSFADYMLGYAQQFDTAPTLASIQYRATSWALYAEDVWKVTRKFTVNYGLRYEVIPPFHDKYRGDMNVVFANRGVLPNGAGLLSNPPAPVVLRGGSGDFFQGMDLHFSDAIKTATGSQLSQYGVGSALIKTTYSNFAPRLGIAYSPNDKWTFRAGAGMFYAQDAIQPVMFDLGRNPAGHPRLTSDLNTPNIPVSNPLVSNTSVCTGWSGLCEGAGALLYAVDTNLRTPYVEQWVANVQRQLKSNLVLEVGYLGNEGHRLQFFEEMNAGTLRTGPSDTRTLAQRRPWPLYGQFDYKGGIANSNYNGLSTKLTQRFSKGLTYLVSFTWSKAIDEGSSLRPLGGDIQTPINPYNFTQDRGLAAYNVGRLFVSSILYELPIGRGKPFLNQNPVVNAVAGGWQLGSIITLADGTPLTPASIGDLTNTGWSQYPDATGMSVIPSGGQTAQQFWNVGAFNATNPQLQYRYGNIARSVLIAPGTIDWDFSAMKNFHIWEQHALQFRFECFNCANHPNWNPPASTATAPSTFGVIQTARAMRQLQFALKYSF
jgi:hypothetical protein